jgi:hypothetical protein
LPNNTAFISGGIGKYDASKPSYHWHLRGIGQIFGQTSPISWQKQGEEIQKSSGLQK